MPFAVSTCDITVVSFESDKISWTNRTDKSYFKEYGTATINKPTGSVFTMQSSETINLASLDCGSGYCISNVDYQLRLYSGYLEYGIYCTEGDDTYIVSPRLPNIHLNIIARV